MVHRRQGNTGVRPAHPSVRGRRASSPPARKRVEGVRWSPYTPAVTDDTKRRQPDLSAFVRPNLDRLAEPVMAPAGQVAADVTTSGGTSTVRDGWWARAATVIAALVSLVNAVSAVQVWRHAHGRV